MALLLGLLLEVTGLRLVGLCVRLSVVGYLAWVLIRAIVLRLAQ
jgi:hypothetical protein